MVALVRIKGTTRQRGLKLRLRDLGKIWVSGFGPSEPAAASSTLRYLRAAPGDQASTARQVRPVQGGADACDVQQRVMSMCLHADVLV